MTDEEKKAIEHLKNYPINWLIENVNESAIKIILNLIKKQSKEIEELKNKNKKLQDKAKELIFEKQELTSALLDSTPNDKIKAKIEEYDKDITVNILNKSAGKTFQQAVHYEVKKVLQSLLRKEFPVTITKEELEKRWKEY